MRILCYILVVLFVTTSAVGQQINPVPDYIFRNSMSVGRNAPTDTSAYFSIGPRFGATRGFMPPMVVDTAAVTGTKRNGLLIYSIQRNSYLYWDSTGNRWSRLASLSDTVTLSTRAWRQKGIDSVASVRIGGSGTINRVPKFTASGTIGNGSIADSSSSVVVTINPTGRIGVNKANPIYDIDLGGSQNMINLTNSSDSGSGIRMVNNIGLVSRIYQGGGTSNSGRNLGGLTLEVANRDLTFFVNGAVGAKFDANRNFIVNNSGTATGLGNRVEITGNIWQAGNAFFATQRSSTGVIIGGGTNNIPAAGLDVRTGLVVRGGVGGALGTALAYDSTNSRGSIQSHSGSARTEMRYIGSNHRFSYGQSDVFGLEMFSNGRVGVNTSTDAGYQFDVSGSIRGTSDAYFATGSGSAKLGVGTTTPVGWVSVIRSGANTSTTNSGFWVSHDASGTASDGLGIGTNGSASYKWLQSFNGALSINAAGNNVGIGNTAPSEALHVTGRIRATTIDSSASPINMLWSTQTGVISKTAPPAFMVSSNATAATSWNFARDVTNSGNISRVTRTHDNAGDTTVTFHIAVYIATASFTTGSWVEVATLPTGYRPSEVVYGALPNYVTGDVYEAQNGTDFAADAEYTGATVFRVLKDGKVQVRVATVTSSVTLSGTNNVLFPISFTFTVRPISV